ncbi:MAG: TolB family protein [Candidatus Dormibacteria bacterium]
MASASCTTGQFAPVLRASTVSQGLDGYTPLVRGKDTLVRLTLSLPSCSAPTDTASLLSAQVSAVATIGTTPTTILGNQGPTPPINTVLPPSIPPYQASPVMDVPGNPMFLVPGAVLAPSGTTSSFPVSFSATITWSGVVNGVSTGPQTLSLGTFKTVQVAQKTNAIRVLAVPMYDSLAGTSSFSTQAQQGLQNAAATSARIMPVQSRTGDLAAAAPSGGFRYSINQGWLDLRAAGTMNTADGRFCGTGSSFDAVKAQLETFRQNWNTANSGTPANQADRVVGVVDQAISDGYVSGCAEGMTAISSTTAFVRVTYGATPLSGTVMAMELDHTLGGIPSGASNFDPYSPYHSKNRNADLSALPQPYNLVTDAYLGANNRSVMQFSASGDGTYSDSNTLLEAPDYNYELSCLGLRSTTCTTGTVGTAVNVAAGASYFEISGTTDGQAAGAPHTTVTESYAGPVQPFFDNTNAIKVVQFSAGLPVGGPYGVVSSVLTSDHTSTTSTVTGPLAEISAAVPLNSATDHIELQNTATSPATVLYTVNRGTSALNASANWTVPGSPPDDGLRTYISPAGQHDPEATVSPDGQWVAFSSGAGTGNSVVAVAPVSDSSRAVMVTDNSGAPFASHDAAWSRDGKTLALVSGGSDSGGDLLTVSFISAGGVAVLGKPSTLPLAALARDPSWSLDDTQLVYESQGNLFKVSTPTATVPTPASVQLTNLTTDSEPTWSPAASGTQGYNLIAFTRSSGCPHNDSPCVMYLNANGGILQAPTEFAGSASAPSWAVEPSVAGAPNTSSGYIGYLSGPTSGVGGVTVARFDGSVPPAQVTPLGSSDAGVSLSGRALVFDRYQTSGTDVLMSTLSQALQVTATGGAGAASMKLDVYYRCSSASGQATYPVKNATAPDSTSGATATWTIQLPSNLGCGGGTFYAAVNDGFNWSGLKAIGGVQDRSAAKPPVPAVANPLDGAIVQAGSEIHLLGSAKDPQDGELSADGCAAGAACPLLWSYTYNGGSAVQAGSGGSVYLDPPGGRWASGKYVFTLLATDSAGLTATTTASVTVPDVVSATESFDPDTLNPYSNGNTVSVAVTVPSGHDLSTINPASVRIVSANGVAYPSSNCPGSTQPACSWTQTTGNQWTATFDRGTMNQFFTAGAGAGLQNQTVYLTVRGNSNSGSAWSFTGSGYTYVQ